jgi:hypothetical protein
VKIVVQVPAGLRAEPFFTTIFTTGSALLEITGLITKE